MSKQIVSNSKSVNVLDIIRGNSRGSKRNRSFVIPSFFINFTKDGINIGAAPQQDVHPEIVKHVKRKTSGHRGRKPGNYVATPANTQDMNLTDSMQLIHSTLAAKKRGLTAMQLADRLDMPMGTVGWALTRMQQRGAVAHAKERKTKAKR